MYRVKQYIKMYYIKSNTLHVLYKEILNQRIISYIHL